MEVVVVELGLYDHVPTETESSVSVGRNGKLHIHFLSKSQMLAPALPPRQLQSRRNGWERRLTLKRWRASSGTRGRLQSETATCWWSWGSQSQTQRTTLDRGKDGVHQEAESSAQVAVSTMMSENAGTLRRGPEVHPGCSSSFSAHCRPPPPAISKLTLRTYLLDTGL